MKRPAALEALSEALTRLPGIAAVTSERLAYHLLSVPKTEAFMLADAIRRARKEILLCSLCGNFDHVDLCGICEDPERDREIVLVVEGLREVLSFEAAGFRGLYHVLHERVAPLEGIQEKDLKIQKLLDRVQASPFRKTCFIRRTSPLFLSHRCRACPSPSSPDPDHPCWGQPRVYSGVL